MAVTTPQMGLKVWNLQTDSYDHAQLAENWAKVDQHNHAEGKGTLIPTGGIENGAISGSKIGNAQVTPEKLSTTVMESVGINSPSVTYRQGVFSEGTYSNSTTSYTLVDSATVTVPANGRLMISYLALQKATTATASIQLFIDGVAIKNPVAGGVPTEQAVASAEVSSFFGVLLTGGAGLACLKGVTADSSFVTTGMGLSSNAYVGLVAGSHKVEVKAKAGAAGNIEIKNRSLWVRTEGYV